MTPTSPTCESVMKELVTCFWKIPSHGIHGTSKLPTFTGEKNMHAGIRVPRILWVIFWSETISSASPKSNQKIPFPTHLDSLEIQTPPDFWSQSISIHPGHRIGSGEIPLVGHTNGSLALPISFCENSSGAYKYSSEVIGHPWFSFYDMTGCLGQG